MCATRTRYDDASVPEAYSGVSPRSEVRVTPIAGKALQFVRKRQTIAFGDSASQPDVLASTVVRTRGGRLARQFAQSIDPLGRDTHVPFYDGSWYRVSERVAF